LTVNCAERDYDASGGIDMMLDVESRDPAGSVSWQISDLVATIDGVIIGPPPPIMLDAPRSAGAATGDVEHDAAATDDESKATEKPRKP
jgi:hypothetical protein